MKYAALLLSLLLVSGCETDNQRKARELSFELRLQAWNACINSGGVPIVSGWVSPPSMESCDYPPQQEGE